MGDFFKKIMKWGMMLAIPLMLVDFFSDKVNIFFGPRGAQQDTSGLNADFGGGVAGQPAQKPDFSIFKPQGPLYDGTTQPALESLRTPNEQAKDYANNVIPRVRTELFGQAPDIYTPNWEPHVNRLSDSTSTGMANMILGLGSLLTGGLGGLSGMFNGNSAAVPQQQATPPPSAPAQTQTAAPPAVYGGQRPTAIVCWGDLQAGGMGRAMKGAINLGRDSSGFLPGTRPPFDYHGAVPQGAAVIMRMGDNDVAGLAMRSDQAIENYAAHMIEVAGGIREAGGLPVIVGLQFTQDKQGNPAGYTENPPADLARHRDTTDKINKALERHAAAAGIPFSETQSLDPALRSDDHLHYTSAGYKAMVGKALGDAGFSVDGPANAFSGAARRGGAQISGKAELAASPTVTPAAPAM